MLYNDTIRQVHFRKDWYGHIDIIASSAKQFGFEFFLHKDVLYAVCEDRPCGWIETNLTIDDITFDTGKSHLIQVN